MITRKDILAHLEQSVRTGFTLGMRQYNPMRAAFCQDIPSSKAFEIFTDFGTPPWPNQNGGKLGSGGTDARTGAQVTGNIQAGQNVQILGGQERSVMVYPVDWEVTVGVTHNAIDDDQVGDLEAWARSAAVQFQKHRDYLAFSALNAGDAATYGIVYDGLYLFSNSHADPGAEYSTVQDNLYGLTLSLDNFRTVKIAASKFLDDRGIPVGLNHRLLIVPPDLEYEAAQIANNRDAYDTANREMNPYAGNVRFMVAPGGWLDATSWYLLDDTAPVKPINLVNRKEPQLAIWDVEENGDGGTRYYKWHARYNVFYGDWRVAIMGNS